MTVWVDHYSAALAVLVNHSGAKLVAWPYVGANYGNRYGVFIPKMLK